MTRRIFTFGVLVFASALAGCSRHDVRCDGKLTPINIPVPAKSDEPLVPAEIER